MRTNTTAVFIGGAGLSFRGAVQPLPRPGRGPLPLRSLCSRCARGPNPTC